VTFVSIWFSFRRFGYHLYSPVSRVPSVGGKMYIGIGTLVVILIIVLIIYFIRRA
jgi:hypothetical protein